MKKKTIIILLILTLSIYSLNINVQSTVKENNYRASSLELTPHEPIEIFFDGNFTDYGFPGTGTAEDPYVIEGYNITTTKVYSIIITNTTKYFVVRNCYIDAKWYGIFIYYVADGTATIINNTCNNHNVFGIWISSSGNSTVVNNTCSNNDCGILLESSGNSTVENNTCNNNYSGIGLYSSGNSTVVNNTCSNNKHGIGLDSSGSSTVANNTCFNNNREGIFLYYSDFCFVTYNLLLENEGYGVYLFFGSDNNLIHHNNFVDNNLGGTSQAFDNCTNNFWYDSTTLEGNYWDDWTGIGSYSIEGDANSVDLYPLVEPVVIEYPQIVLLTLLFFIVPFLLIRTISKKAKK